MQTIGKYKVVKQLGAGGFGAVYLAQDPRLGLQVAIKVFDVRDENLAGHATSASTDAQGVLKQRFIAEAKTLHQLSSSPYIVNIKEYDELEDGTPYYVMPYLPNSLENDIGKDAFTRGKLEDTPKHLHPRKLAAQRAVDILKQILEALSAVHRAGLVHRDIKPANILFDDQGNVQLCDFGIAKVADADFSQSGVGMGSRNYMSPEQRESAKYVTPASDVYSVGVLAYRMFTGQLPTLPFKAAIEFAPEIGQPLNKLIEQAIAQQDSQRPQDGAAFLQQFNSALKSWDDNAPESDEATGTWVEQGSTQIKSELKPLQDRILTLLKQQGEITPKDMPVLQALADIGNLDETELQQLIDHSQVQLANDNQQFKALQGWVNAINKQTEQGPLSQDKQNALIEAGIASTGKSKEELTALIIAKQSKAQNAKPKIPELNSPQAEAAEKQAASAKPVPTQRPQPTKSKASLMAALIVVLLGIGGYFGYDAYQQSQEALRQQTIAARNEQSAWQQAQQLNTVDGYGLYLKNWPKGEHSSQAKRLQNELAEQARQANLSAEQQQAEQIKLAQQLLIQLGYKITDSGTLDTRTQKAIEAFEKEQKLLVTGQVDSVLITNLKQTLNQQQDEQAWQQAKQTNTIVSYESYLNSQTSGEYRQQAQNAIDDIKLESRKIALTITTEPSDATIQILNIEAKYQQGIKLLPGEYQLKLSKAGYISQTHTINLSTQQSQYRYALKQAIPEDASYRVGNTSFTVKNIPAGSFMMGSIEDNSEKPVHRVAIKAFKLMDSEVTFAMWDACVAAGGCTHKPEDEGWGRGNRPVMEVSYGDIIEQFIPWLNGTTGQRFRLPSEAEWEYAARAGSTTKYSWGDNITCSQARYGNSDGDCGNDRKTVPVKSYSANAFGLYDMHGNVWEWTQDCWNANYQGAPSDGSAYERRACMLPVLRGGSWYNTPSDLRSAYRVAGRVYTRGEYYGFRLAQDLQ